MKRIIQDVRMHKMDESYWMSATYFDLLKGVLRARGLSNDVSVESAMALFELEPTGSAHRALDDARMTSEIFRAVFKDLDFERSQHYVDTFSNAKERKTVKVAIKAMTSQKLYLPGTLSLNTTSQTKQPLRTLVSFRNCTIISQHKWAINKFKQQQSSTL